VLRNWGYHISGIAVQIAFGVFGGLLMIVFILFLAAIYVGYEGWFWYTHSIR